MVFDGNDEVRTAANIGWVEMGPAALHKMDLARNGEICNVVYPRWVETDLPASHKMEYARNGAVHCVCQAK